MAVSHLRNTPITGKSYTTPVDATPGTTATYVKADTFEVAKALSALCGEEHPLVAAPAEVEGHRRIEKLLAANPAAHTWFD